MKWRVCTSLEQRCAFIQQASFLTFTPLHYLGTFSRRQIENIIFYLFSENKLYTTGHLRFYPQSCINLRTWCGSDCLSSLIHFLLLTFHRKWLILVHAILNPIFFLEIYFKTSSAEIITQYTKRAYYTLIKYYHCSIQLGSAVLWCQDHALPSSREKIFLQLQLKRR